MGSASMTQNRYMHCTCCKIYKKKLILPRLLMEMVGMCLTFLIYGAVMMNQVCYGISENKKKFTVESGKRIVSSLSTITTKTDSSIACSSLCTSKTDCVTASYDNLLKQCLLDSDCTPTTETWQNALLIRIGQYELLHLNKDKCLKMQSYNIDFLV